MRTTENVKRQNIFLSLFQRNNNVSDEKQTKTKLQLEDSIKTNDLKVKRNNEAPTEEIDIEKQTEKHRSSKGQKSLVSRKSSDTPKRKPRRRSSDTPKRKPQRRSSDTPKRKPRRRSSDAPKGKQQQRSPDAPKRKPRRKKILRVTTGLQVSVNGKWNESHEHPPHLLPHPTVIVAVLVVIAKALVQVVTALFPMMALHLPQMSNSSSGHG